MDRITRADLDQALESHRAALAALDINYQGDLKVDSGSKTYGRAYRLYRTNVPQGGPDGVDGRYVYSSAHFNPPVGGDFLGMTAREAYENLTNRTRVLWDVAYQLKETRRGDLEASRDEVTELTDRLAEAVIEREQWKAAAIRRGAS